MRVFINTWSENDYILRDVREYASAWFGSDGRHRVINSSQLKRSSVFNIPTQTHSRIAQHIRPTHDDDILRIQEPASEYTYVGTI